MKSNKKDVNYIEIENPTVEATKLYTKMVGMGDLQGFTLVGPAGMGKTYTVRNVLDDLKIKYELFGGHISIASTYEFLYINNDKLIIFDDVSQVVNKVEIMEMLKQALNTTGQPRIIHYHSMSPLTKDFPKNFEFTGRVIFIFNEINKKNPNVQAIMDRAPVVDMVFSRKEIFNAMYKIANSEGHNLSINEKVKITKEIEKHYDSSMDISLRKQQLAFNVYNSLKKMGRCEDDWISQIKLIFGKKKESWIREIIRDIGGEEGIVSRNLLINEISNRFNLSPRTAQRRIAEYLELGSIFQSAGKGGDIGLKPFNIVKD